MKNRLITIMTLAALPLLAGCGGIKPIELTVPAPGSGALIVTVQDARAAAAPETLSAQLFESKIFFATRPVPDLVHDAVAAALEKHGVHDRQFMLRLGRFGIDIPGTHSFEDWVTAVWGVQVADGAGHPLCAVAVRADVKIDHGQRAAAFQSALDQAVNQVVAAAACVPGTGL